MGKGLAREFALRYKGIETWWKNYCRRRGVRPGEVIAYPIPEDKIILCFPTKDHWSEPSKLEYIHAGLDAVKQGIHHGSGLTSIAFPALGCGLGGLYWRQVRPLFEQYFQGYNGEIEVYEPHAAL